MAERSALTLAFIEQKPLTAGRVLAAMEPDDAAAFLDPVPTRYTAIALSAMGAWPASSVIGRMEAASAAAALQGLAYQDAAAILRITPVEDRPQLLGALPGKLKRDFEMSLSFPEDTVGAHMTTAIMTLTRDHTIADAIDLVSRSPASTVEVVFIVDDEKKFIGAVSAPALLRSRKASVLGEVMDISVARISARSRLNTLVNLDAWDDYAELPVVSRQRHVIGALSRRTAHTAQGRRLSGRPAPQSSAALSLMEAFLASALGLSELLADASIKPSDDGGRRS